MSFKRRIIPDFNERVKTLIDVLYEHLENNGVDLGYFAYWGSDKPLYENIYHNQTSAIRNLRGNKAQQPDGISVKTLYYFIMVYGIDEVLEAFQVAFGDCTDGITPEKAKAYQEWRRTHTVEGTKRQREYPKKRFTPGKDASHG